MTVWEFFSLPPGLRNKPNPELYTNAEKEGASSEPSLDEFIATREKTLLPSGAYCIPSCHIVYVCRPDSCSPHVLFSRKRKQFAIS